MRHRHRQRAAGARQRGPQRGLSIIGFLFVAAVLIVAALVGFRILPSYVEYFTVQKALEASLADQANQTPQDVRRSLERRLNADYVDAVRASDLTVSKEGNTVVASLAWQKILHMVGNASILLDFEATANR
jgi:membrane protein required for beta-lactamase induction